MQHNTLLGDTHIACIHGQEITYYKNQLVHTGYVKHTCTCIKPPPDGREARQYGTPLRGTRMLIDDNLNFLDVIAIQATAA